MTGFFATIAARAVGAPAALKPRPAHRFEPLDTATPGTGEAPLVADDRTISPSPAPARPPETPPTRSPAGRSPAARRTGQDVGLGETSTHGTRTEEPTHSADPADAAADSPHSDDLDRALQAARAAAARAARLAADPPGRARRDERHPPAQQQSPPTDGQDVAAPPAPAASGGPDTAPDAGRPPAPLEQVQPTPAPLGTLAGQQPAELERDDPPQTPLAHPVRPRTRPARPVDLAALLREQVFAALNERGSVPDELTPVVSTTPTRRAPRPGTAELHAEGVRIDQPTEQAAPGDVHVHIACVSVTQPVPPPPPRVSRSETVRRTVDHQAYLARRRERG